MGLFDSIFQNKSVQEMALGAIKKMARENGIQFIMIEVRPDNELDFKMYKADDQPVILSADQATKTKQILQDFEDRHEKARAFIESLEKQVLALEVENKALSVELAAAHNQISSTNNQSL